jgi:hypothetical protein
MCGNPHKLSGTLCGGPLKRFIAFPRRPGYRWKAATFANTLASLQPGLPGHADAVRTHPEVTP